MILPPIFGKLRRLALPCIRLHCLSLFHYVAICTGQYSARYSGCLNPLQHCIRFSNRTAVSEVVMSLAGLRVLVSEMTTVSAGNVSFNAEIQNSPGHKTFVWPLRLFDSIGLNFKFCAVAMNVSLFRYSG